MNSMYKPPLATNDLSDQYKKELAKLTEKHSYDVVSDTANNIGILDDTNFRILRMDLNKLSKGGCVKYVH